MEEQLLGLQNQQGIGELRQRLQSTLVPRSPITAVLTPGTDLGPLCILGAH